MKSRPKGRKGASFCKSTTDRLHPIENPGSVIRAKSPVNHARQRFQYCRRPMATLRPSSSDSFLPIIRRISHQRPSSLSSASLFALKPHSSSIPSMHLWFVLFPSFSSCPHMSSNPCFLLLPDIFLSLNTYRLANEIRWLQRQCKHNSDERQSLSLIDRTHSSLSTGRRREQAPEPTTCDRRPTHLLQYRRPRPWARRYRGLETPGPSRGCRNR